MCSLYARLDNKELIVIDAWLLKLKIYHSELNSLNPDIARMQLQSDCVFLSFNSC